MLAELDIMQRLLTGKPIFVGFNVTNRCNMRCRFCNVPKLQHRDMILPEIDHAFSLVAGLGIPVVGITGGEPFLRPDLADIIALASQHGLKVTIVTNGELFNRQRAEELRRFDNIIHFALSADTLDQGLYKQFRGKSLPGILDRYLAAIPFGPRTAWKLNVVLGPENVDEVDDLLAVARANGLFLSFIPINAGPGGLHRGDAHPDLTPENRQRIADTFARLRTLKLAGEPLFDHRNFYTLAARYILGEPLGDCRAGQLFLDLRSDGKLAMCNELVPFIDLLEVPKLTLADLRRHRKEWTPRMEQCRQEGGCCYTCSYNITATAQHLPQYVFDYLRLTAGSLLWRG